MIRQVTSRSGFTLIELLVVISIVSLLIAILLPALSAAREAAKTVTCMSQQRQIALASTLYAHDHDGYFPLASLYGVHLYPSWPRNSLDAYLNEQSPYYFKPRKTIFACPTYYEAGPLVHNTPGAYISYTYNEHYGSFAFGTPPVVTNSDNRPMPLEFLAEQGLYRGGPSEKAFMVDGCKDNPVRARVGEFFLTTASRGILSLHPGQNNNMAFFDGHVETLKRDEIVGSEMQLWFLFWRS